MHFYSLLHLRYFYTDKGNCEHVLTVLVVLIIIEVVLVSVLVDLLFVLRMIERVFSIL